MYPRDEEGRGSRKRVFGRFLVVGLLAFALVAGTAFAQHKLQESKIKRFEVTRGISEAGRACIECHKKTSPAIVYDWAKSAHGRSNITCIDCHKAETTDKDISKEHFKQYSRSDMPYGERKYEVPITAVVTPKDCSRCHPDEVEEYSRSKHANTLELIWKIDPWLNKGMNSKIERKTGCYACHGTVLKLKDGKLTSDTWPNVGVGRLNLDGSKGSCSSCHTRHRFSLAEARKPEACGQCHLGPDHPQIEIYKESKHGAIYEMAGHKWNFDAAPGMWTPGVDYRTPTCAACHMSGSGKTATTHDCTERLSWELQAPLTVRPENFKAWPAKNNWKTEREKMKEVCRQCHGDHWINAHYANLDKVVHDYNNIYFKPVKKILDNLYEKKLLDSTKFFDEDLEVEFYELWHHEGRRARMGTAMMAPDYAWWHGFYECKKRYNKFMAEAAHVLKTGKPAHVHKPYPAATGSTKKPVEIFGPGK